MVKANPNKKLAQRKSTKRGNGKAKKRVKFEKAEHGFVYIGHLPHGFFEEEIKGYFAQFGKVMRVRVARSKKTGNYRGYGFIEFADKDVAQIAAETMNNYLMFNKILKCHVIPKEKIHPDTFRNAGKLFVKPVKSWLRKTFNRKRSVEQLKKLKEKQDKKMAKRTERLKELGINLDFSKLSQLNTTVEETKKATPKSKTTEETVKKTAVVAVTPKATAKTAQPVEAMPKKSGKKESPAVVKKEAKITAIAAKPVKIQSPATTNSNKKKAADLPETKSAKKFKK